MTEQAENQQIFESADVVREYLRGKTPPTSENPAIQKLIETRFETELRTVVRPMNDKVLILPDAAETVSKGGIVIPGVAQDKPTMGTVIAVGPGMIGVDGERHAPGVVFGDRVIYGKFAGVEIKVDDVPHRIMREAEILAVADREIRALPERLSTPQPPEATIEPNHYDPGTGEFNG